MKRLGLVLVGGAVWLFLAAIPAFADGGPHISAVNNGSAGITADSCAGCHRVHTAQGPMLLKSADEEALCLACHGSAGVGATTDVMTGIQYKVALPAGSVGQDKTNLSVVLGALRNGGFLEARIDSSHPTRLLLSFGASTGNQFTALVPVASSGHLVTSAHLDLDGTTGGAVVSQGIAWGNGGVNSTPAGNAGPSVTMSCATCHNPHGNGKFRILNPIPAPDVSSGAFTPAASPGASVTDSPMGAQDASTGAYPTKNYTVKPGVFATDVTGAAASGDYWRRCTPDWDNCTTINRGDKPNNVTTFVQQISAWCSTCHSRYLAGGGSATYPGGPSGDTIFAFRHTTNLIPECTQCHVGHGSNALMSGPSSGSFPYPNSSQSAPNFSDSSRLLKIDNRGTCQACHDPTDTITANGTVNTTP